MPSTRDPLRLSLVLLAFITMLALAGLAIEGNWTKLLRVAVSAAVHFGLVTILARPIATAAAGPPWWPFGLAGAAAGLASGLMRSDTTLRLVLVDVVAAAAFLASAHCLAVRFAPRVRRWLVS